MKLALLQEGLCAICRVSPKVHARCSVCEGTNQHMRLCRFCHAWHKKVGWNEKRLDLVDEDLDDGSKVTTARPLRDAMAPTRGRGRPRSSRIDDNVIPRLRRRRFGRPVIVERVDALGRKRGTYVRWIRVSRREIARQAGCSHWSVDHRYHDYARARTRTSRACSARPITKLVK